MLSDLDKSIQYIKSVGPKRAEAFAKSGLETIRDLLHYFPFKYLDRSNILNSKTVQDYIRSGYNSEVTIIGNVLTSEVIRYGKKQILKVIMQDEFGTFDGVWFQGVKFFKDSFSENSFYAISGKPVLTKYGHLQFAHPDFDKIENEESKAFLNTGRIIPFYRLPGELKLKNIGAISIRRIINTAVEKYYRFLPETLPSHLIEKRQLLTKSFMIKNLHFPESKEVLEKALYRLKYEEIFYFETLIAIRKSTTISASNSYHIKFNKPLMKSFIKSLNFDLTSAQLKVLSEIRSDMESDHNMNRLLQGDVGSGKTIVALISILSAIDNGYQAALMAPTEVLASQHFLSISKMLQQFKTKVFLLTGSVKSKKRQEILKIISENKNCLIIGTHALIEDEVLFDKLALVVIDEQHRFGVAQRHRLINKSIRPHVLVMTATPIPRTLTMTIYGDLDVSIIDELPKNRIPIKTAIRSEKKLPEIYTFIKERIDNGEQAFLIYPLVEDSEKIDLKSAKEAYENLSKNEFQKYNVGLIHGKMKWDEKEEVMAKFASHKFDILIATTVVEVGIDIPDATIMLINEAYRFGLSQLHQLRGRVGRRNKQSYCILITRNEIHRNKFHNKFSIDFLSPAEKEKYKSYIRLKSMETNSGGFELSEIDLKLRGPGDIFGTNQSGLPNLKYTDIVNDKDIIMHAKDDAFNVIHHDNNLKKNENNIIERVLSKHYKKELTYAKTL